MGWVRVDDDFYDHQKFSRLGPHAIALWVTGLAWCNRNLTDGFIPIARARILLDFTGHEIIGPTNGVTPTFCIEVDASWVIRELCEAGLWEEAQDGYQVHDYRDFQPSSDEVKGRHATVHEAKVRAGRTRAAGALRDSAGRLKAQVNASTTSRPSSNGSTSPPAPTPTPIKLQLPSPPLVALTDPLQGFQNFWEAYPRRNGKRLGRGLCEGLWKKLSLEDKRAAWRGAKNYALAVDGGITIAKDPERFLKHRLWTDWQEPATPDRNGSHAEGTFMSKTGRLLAEDEYGNLVRVVD
jgi:hypothetical protein